MGKSKYRDTDRGKAYSRYCGMLQRCYNPSHIRYDKYGGVGVTICEEWLGKEGFNSFFSWWKLQENRFKSEYFIDKDIICNEKNIKPHRYSPSTCKLVPREENQRNYNGLLRNNTSGYTGVSRKRRGWGFRLTNVKEGNINRSGFDTALNSAKAREAYIIIYKLNYKIERVGTTNPIKITDREYINEV